MEEESGTPITQPSPPLRDPDGFAISPTMVQPTPEQLQKIADAIKAINEAIDALGATGGMLAKFMLKKVLQGLRELGPIPPLMPPGTQEPSDPPPTTPP